MLLLISVEADNRQLEYIASCFSGGDLLLLLERF